MNIFMILDGRNGKLIREYVGDWYLTTEKNWSFFIQYVKINKMAYYITFGQRTIIKVILMATQQKKKTTPSGIKSIPEGVLC